MRVWPFLARRLEPQAAAAFQAASAAGDFFKSPGQEPLARLKRLRRDALGEPRRSPARVAVEAEIMAQELWDALAHGAGAAEGAVSDALRLSAACDRFMAELAAFNAQAARAIVDALKASDGSLSAERLARARSAAVSCEALFREARRFSLSNHPVVDGFKAQAVYAALRDGGGAFFSAADGLLRALGD